MAARFIILTTEQANDVRGLYSLNSTLNIEAELHPVPLKDGNWALPEDILTDPLRPYNGKRAMLETMPVIELTQEDFIDTEI